LLTRKRAWNITTMENPNNIEANIYDIVKAISYSDTPIMFKGAVVTKLILSLNNYSEVERGTKDIDANWIHGKPNPDQIAKSVTEAMQKSGLPYHAVLYRPYGDHKSAGLYICHDETETLITKMDIDVKPLGECSLYHCGEAMSYGSSVDQILADKISVLSCDRLFRRSKDLIDVYALSSCTTSATNNIYNILEKTNKTIGDFNAFTNRVNDLEHAYSLLHGVKNKPDFADVYRQISAFLEPFKNKQSNLIWTPETSAWTPLTQELKHEKESETWNQDNGRDEIEEER
jgi:hypothetical protein